MKGIGSTGLAYLWEKIKSALGVKEDKATIVNHGTSDTTFALTPNVLHTWGTINSLTLTLASGSSTYVDGYWFKFTAGSSFTALTMPSGVNWVTEPEIEAGKTYEVMIVDGLASYVTDGIGDSVKAKTRIVNHGTSDITYQLAPNEFHIWGEVASLNLTLKPEANGYVSGYWFRFTSGSTPTVVTLPNTVQWYYDNGFVVEANKTYEVTIIDGYACYTDYTDDTHVATKLWVENNTQAPLESGTNIKTINNESILGSGNITISGGGGEANVIESISINGTAQTVTSKNIDLAVPTSSTVTAIVTLTEAQYTALATKDSSTLYIITA